MTDEEANSRKPPVPRLYEVEILNITVKLSGAINLLINGRPEEARIAMNEVLERQGQLVDKFQEGFDGAK